MRRKDWILISFLIIFYLVILFLFKRSIFSYRFDKKLIDRYFLSQDIPHEVKGKRLFLSDNEIYMATGYLYAKGADPSVYNFDHPPLIKYLFGYSILFLGSPYPVQVLFGVAVLLLTYYLGLRVFQSPGISFFASFLLTIDPLFLDISSASLLDLGEAVFLLMYMISMLFFKRNFIFQGIILGLLAGAKSLVSPLFFVTILLFYQWYKKELKIKEYFLHLVVAFVAFSFLYTRTFLERGGEFNIIFFILKTVKYRIQHNITSLPGSSLLLFLTGFFQTWWDEKGLLREKVWTVLWPISFLVMTIKIYTVFQIKKLTIKDLLTLTPFLYLFYLGVQAPFARYFLIILPFSYLSLSEFIWSNLNKLILLKAKPGQTRRKK
ncbi:hypothetical protein HY612_01985 [Candidatus Roizmanbacteria bacterium]|nr:hypothetical protein [Candidatus Roizmanbacteria bacterium]